MNTAKLGMNTSVIGEALEPAQDAIAAAYWAWERLRDATTLPAQAEAVNALGNAMSDLATWHEDWDGDRGILWDADSLAEHNASI